MKFSYLFRKGLRWSCLLTTALALQGGCVPVMDVKNRENQIKNTSKTFVEAYMTKRVLRNKEAILNTYEELFRLQDSIQQALRDVRSVEKLRVASLEAEWKEVKNLESHPLVYMEYEERDDYTRHFGQLLQSSDVRKSSEELFRMIHGMRWGFTLPGDYGEMKALAKARNTFLFNLQEYLDKRALTASQGYRNWAEVYRLKGMELQEALLQDKRFTMTDLERIETERLAEKYIGYSLEFMEKSDSLLAAGKEARNPWKAGAEIKIKNHLRLQKLAN